LLIGFQGKPINVICIERLLALPQRLDSVDIALQKQILLGRLFIKNAIKTNHGKITLCGLLVGLLYLPSWLWFVTVFTFIGSIFPLVSISATGLGLTELWQSRSQISQMRASSIDRRWGHGLIYFSIALFPFCWGKIWAQGFCWAVILIGIALSSWGLNFFRKHKISVLLLLCTAYPPLILSLADRLWKNLAPPTALEGFMAWAGGSILNVLGYSATSNGVELLLHSGGVTVMPACNGFEMMVTIICVTLLTGIAFQMRKRVILLLAILGTLLALSLNVLRVALMAFAIAYWGAHAFEFWHGFWGGQIFASVLLTIYYYLVMAVLPNSSNSQNNAVSDSSNL
jgi:exosortase/archaeosortase family protein